MERRSWRVSLDNFERLIEELFFLDVINPRLSFDILEKTSRKDRFVIRNRATALENPRDTFPIFPLRKKFNTFLFSIRLHCFPVADRKKSVGRGWRRMQSPGGPLIGKYLFSLVPALFAT